MNLTVEVVRAIVLRWPGYLALWVALIGLDPLDLAVGALAATVATWASLRLLPPDSCSIRLTGLPGLVLRFFIRSVSGGIDVARRAFSPSMPLQPGLMRYRPGYPRGFARTTFASMTSLLPGTLAVRDDDQGLLYHCLDLEQPVASELEVEEQELARALPRPRQ